MNLQIIQELDDQHQLASCYLRRALSERWPEGTPVRCLLSASQKNPSSGTVCDYMDDGVLRVRLDTVNSRGYHTVKSVHWKNILSS